MFGAETEQNNLLTGQKKSKCPKVNCSCCPQLTHRQHSNTYAAISAALATGAVITTAVTAAPAAVTAATVAAGFSIAAGVKADWESSYEYPKDKPGHHSLTNQRQNLIADTGQESASFSWKRFLFKTAIRGASTALFCIYKPVNVATDAAKLAFNFAAGSGVATTANNVSSELHYACKDNTAGTVLNAPKPCCC